MADYGVCANFVFLLSLALCTGQGIQQLSVTEGDNITIQCTVFSAYPVWTGPELYNGLVQPYNNHGNSSFPNPKVPEQKRSRLAWDSDKSSLIIRDVILSDRGLYQCSSVAKINLTVRVPPHSPVISNTEVSDNGTLVVRLSQSQQTSLVCISSGGYPQSQVVWYRGNTGTKPLTSTSTVNSVTDYFNMAQTYTFTPQRQDDGVKYICQSSFPTAPRHISTISAELLLNLRPNSPKVEQISIVSAGNQIVVKCITTGSRPAASIIWSYNNKNLHGEDTTTLDDVTKTNTVTSLLKFIVKAEDNGQSIQCRVTHYLLVNPSQLIASMDLNVHYPPTVSVNATNTTIKESSTILKCMAKGNPDGNYMYGKWIQTWSGFDVPVMERQGSETLVLTDLTYEHSGYYTCTASNGIKVFGTDNEFMQGAPTQLFVKSFPIIIMSDERTASRINKNVTVHIDFFSNVADSDVRLYRDDSRISEVIYSVTKVPVDVELPVFSHMVKTNGIRASITIQIKSVEDYGSYMAAVSNEVGFSNTSFEVRMTERPSTPSGFTIDYIHYNRARLSWKRGYNGGLPQTFVIQVGSDEKTWSNVEVYDDIKQNDVSVSKVLTDLRESTTYFVRLYAYNDEGNSSFSQTLNFTTTANKESVLYKTNNTNAVIVGAILGLLITGLAIYAIYVTLQLRRSREPVTKEGLSINLAEKKDNSRDEGISESQYTELNRELQNQESAYDAISSI